MAKHKGFSMYRPSAVVIAQTIGDLPIFFVQVVIFTIIVYFMAGLKMDAGLYFTFLLFTYVTTVCTTAFFRFVGYSFGTFNDASKVSGLAFSILVTVSGPARICPQLTRFSTPVISSTCRRCTRGSHGSDGSTLSTTRSRH